MEVRSYHFKNILNIESLGITYFNENKDICLIKFDECRKNWIQYAGKISKPEDAITTSRCVGERNISGKPAYLEFFSDEPIRIFFPMKRKWYEKLLRLPSTENHDFHRIQLKIIEVGYATYDLT